MNVVHFCCQKMLFRCLCSSYCEIMFQTERGEVCSVINKHSALTLPGSTSLLQCPIHKRPCVCALA